MKRAKNFVAMSLMLVLSACCHDPIRLSCPVTPPVGYKGNMETAQKISADLSKVASSPITVSLENNFKNTVEVAFQQIPEKAVACQMTLQAIVCLSQRQDEGGDKMAMKLIDYLNEKNVCAQQLKLFTQ